MTTSCFCPRCGAANPIQHTRCFACQQPLDSEGSRSPSDVLLNGRYRLLARLGSGGYSAVYKALDTRSATQHIVAIKQIRLKGLSTQEIIEATDTFHREVGLLSSLDHPRLPRIFDRFSDRDDWYVVMDYIEGQTLEAYLEQQEAAGKRLSPIAVLEMGLQLCAVLSYLHSRQPPVIYRDLKPGNIIHAHNGQLFLIDFGIARTFRAGQARDTMPLGSPGYAAPEQYGKTQTTPQADIYSLGALLHRMLSGRDPSEQPLHLAPLSPPAMVGGEDLAALIQRMLSLEARRRPQSMREVAAELERIKRQQLGARQQGIVASPMPASSAAGGAQSFSWSASGFQQQQHVPVAPSRRISRRALVAAGLVGSGALLLGGLLWQGSRSGISQHSSGQPTPDLPKVGQVYWSPTLQSVALTFGEGSLVEIRDGQTQRLIHALNAGLGTRSTPPSVFAVSWSLDETRLFISTDAGQSIWRRADGQHVASNTSNSSSSFPAAWSPDGTRIASSDFDGNLQILRATDAAQIWTQAFSAEILPQALTWSPDNQHLAFVSGTNNPYAQNKWTVAIWDVTAKRHTRDIVGTIKGDSFEPVMAWSPAGAPLALGVGDILWILDPRDAAAPYRLKEEASALWQLAWSPDGRLLAIAARSDPSVVEVWSPAERKKVQSFNTQNNSDFTYFGTITALGWSADSSRVAVAYDNRNIQIWKVK